MNTNQLCYVRSHRIIILAMLAFIGGCSLFHKKPPYQDPDRLVSILKVTPPSTSEPVTGIDLREWRAQSRFLSPIAAYISRDFTLTGSGEPERIFCGRVSTDFFPMLGVSPVIGRTFLPDEHLPGGPKVAVLSYGLWQRIYNGDSAIIGRTIKLDQESVVIIGIMPDDFQLPERADLWMPLNQNDEMLLSEGDGSGLNVIARLKSGITIEQAQAEMNTISHSIELKYPETNKGRIIKVDTPGEAKRLFPPKPTSTTIHIYRK
jgi:putative ABC transport system permease protein